LIAIASPDTEPADHWRNLALLEYSPASAFHWEVDAFMRERELHPSSAGTLDDAFLMLAAVTRGGFVAFVPRAVAREALSAGRVKQLAGFHTRHASVQAIYHAGTTLRVARDAVQRLIDAARDNSDNTEE
jgi:DNA-binding transcriptional LysR family regulator